jgi:hypothetical protein
MQARAVRFPKISSAAIHIAVTLAIGATASANRITANGTGIKAARSGNVISQNEVSSNTTVGIVFTGVLNQNRITQNSIYGNTGLGIDLGGAGVTANDGATSAGSSNNGMDYPVVTSAMLNGSTLTLRGYFRASDAVTFAFSLNTTYSGVNFADVPDIVFNTDGAQTNLPGSFVIYAHTFTAQSAGQVSFSSTDASVPALNGWNVVFYRDSNGDGKLNAGEPAISGPVALTAGETVSILIKEFIPADASFNAQDKLTVTASFVYANTTPTISSTASRADVTTVGNPVTAGLTLVKAVDKQTARPGDTITYTITSLTTAAMSSVM